MNNISDFKHEMIKYGIKSDKIFEHNYHIIYSLYLHRFKESKNSIVEIGILNGDSGDMWLKLLPNMYFYGVDILHEPIKTDRYEIIKADQSKKEDLLRIKETINKKVDIIIDDGSHIPEHQILTFNVLFPKLEKGGVYIIEDIETSYWTKGNIYNYETNYGIDNKMNLINIFQKVNHNINYNIWKHNEKTSEKYKEFRKTEIDTEILDNIESVTFARNCIIITKKEDFEKIEGVHYVIEDHLNVEYKLKQYVD